LNQTNPRGSTSLILLAAGFWVFSSPARFLIKQEKINNPSARSIQNEEIFPFLLHRNELADRSQ